MMRFEAGKERWVPMEIRGVAGYFCDVRIDQKTVPGRFHFWELADGDSDGIPCRYRPGILVNFYGTFLTSGELPLDEPEYQLGYIDPDGWRFTGDQSVDLAEAGSIEKGGGVR